MYKFVNRDEELRGLHREYEKFDSSLFIIYGRRRVGKTALIRKFIEDKPLSLYFLATEEVENENIRSIQQLVANFTKNSLLSNANGIGWIDIFKIFSEYKTNQKKILIIDEFQYLGKSNPAFPSIFQKVWDEIFKDSNIMVILCGSHIHMMEAQTLNYSSPLYGRRTGQIKLKPIKFKHYCEFFNKKTQSQLIELYAVTGGIPRYAEVFKDTVDIFEGIEKNIILNDSFLYEEPIFLLEKEISEVGSYFSIIKTIAQGNHKIGQMASILNVPQSKLTYYLNTLINLELIERSVPITEKFPEKSKKGLYYIKDNFINFWFKFIYPYKNYTEINNISYVINKIKTNFIDNHVSFIYEKICEEELLFLSIDNKLPFYPLKVGNWWNGQEEIDIIGFNDETNEIIFCECKYLNRPVGSDVFFKLMEKSKKVDWNKDNRKEYFAIFSKSGFDPVIKGLTEKYPLLLFC
jgi:AAA+ ATPase superfamily predicted ATPase